MRAVAAQTKPSATIEYQAASLTNTMDRIATTTHGGGSGGSTDKNIAEKKTATFDW